TRALSDAIQAARQADVTYAGLVATVHLADVRMFQGQLRAAATLCRQGLDLATERAMDQLPIAAHLQLALGRLDYEWNDLESAEPHLQASIKRVTAREQAWVLVDGFTALARIRRTHGDEEGARELFRQAEQAVDSVDVAWAAPYLAPAQARLALAQGQAARA